MKKIKSVFTQLVFFSSLGLQLPWLLGIIGAIANSPSHLEGTEIGKEVLTC